MSMSNESYKYFFGILINGKFEYKQSILIFIFKLKKAQLKYEYQY